MFSVVSRLSINKAEGGYDYKFIEGPADYLKCLICLLVVMHLSMQIPTHPLTGEGGDL